MTHPMDFNTCYNSLLQLLDLSLKIGKNALES
jgi:hypothetical protein